MRKLIVVRLIPSMLILTLAAVQAGCAVDTALRQIDRMCDAETKTKAEYRKCLENQYTDFKSAVRLDKTEEATQVEGGDDDEI